MHFSFIKLASGLAIASTALAMPPGPSPVGRSINHHVLSIQGGEYINDVQAPLRSAPEFPIMLPYAPAHRVKRSVKALPRSAPEFPFTPPYAPIRSVKRSVDAPLESPFQTELIKRSHPELSSDDTCGIVGAGKNSSVSCNPDYEAGGFCCSAWGYCGNTVDHCGEGCQPEYGWCAYANEVQITNITNALDAMEPSVKGTIIPRFEELKSPRCGFEAANASRMCANHECCSSAGYCGVTEAYCQSPECQPKFGRCDSDATPNGPPTANDPRPLIGSVSYNKTIYHCAKEKVVGLTFDDGPSEYTEKLLDILKSYGFRATFFITGNNNGKHPIDEVEQWSRVILRMDREGHQIGSHTWSHYRLDDFDSSFRLAEMEKNERAIANILGKYPTYMRAPYGGCAAKTGCHADMENLGYHRIEHNLNTDDWRYPSAEEIQISKDLIKEQLDDLPSNGNALSIQHDIIEQSALNLSTYLFDAIAEKGWKGVTVGECLFDPAENWYRFATINEPSVPLNKTIKAITTTPTCYVSVGGFCGTIRQFNGRAECQISAQDCHSQAAKCPYEVGSESGSDCQDYADVCDQLDVYCELCEGEARRPEDVCHGGSFQPQTPAKVIRSIEEVKDTCVVSEGFFCLILFSFETFEDCVESDLQCNAQVSRCGTGSDLATEETCKKAAKYCEELGSFCYYACDMKDAGCTSDKFEESRGTKTQLSVESKAHVSGVPMPQSIASPTCLAGRECTK